ncbi:class I poly(R)-hydroxyalkanoic acid synthase [Corticibacter populi]|uniref:Class I poly(R)-hydroxyalkanoic acid synthase n=1 Tax=Corticibacter populi TaxID=1550736 RepID=A0A3M6R0K6_9BURK|nr:class I poly(R)-hydroxyalkanoic acid synthase [Corticibacter populi]RMX08342.1 class I poly(R)-hydroxyalkanoic acid synthase [Corticibacter populi]RZS35634.1 polyhydroxyalkanoate synthase [Corticibacter populi]
MSESKTHANGGSGRARNDYWAQFQQIQRAALQNWTTLLQQGLAPAAGGTGTGTNNAQTQPPLSNPFEAFAKAAREHGGSGGQALVYIPPEKLQQLQQEYLDQVGQLLRREGSEIGEVLRSDKRFASAGWLDNGPAAMTAALYKINASALQKMVEITETDDKTRARLQFAVDQWLAAAAPTNFLALNPDAQLKAITSKGESISRGLMNMWQDMQRGHISMTDEAQFEVGRNLAITPGAVVFENEFFQLIEYTPSTTTVHQRPFLLIPPCINKYYILDLQPGNSFIEYIVAQGHRTFVVSWRNPDQSMDTRTWDDYIEHGAIRAIEAVQDIGAADTINALGFCVGGTILATALAVLAARDQHPVESATLLTTLVDFSDTGILDIFIDENTVRFRELQMGQKGLMRGQDLATTFSFLRPNELVWNYVVGNYLKGETPPPFDLLYWNSDGTNLPGPFYAWYLRNTYLENNLVQPGKTTVCGARIDFGQVRTPLYIYGSRDDHIVPIRAAYASTQVFPGPKRFVTGASGHIAGVINPPARGKRNYWVSDANAFPPDWNDWMAGARLVPGSWWPDWIDWLAGHAGGSMAAPTNPGDEQTYKVIEPAPGRYVKQGA